jgi:patatin-like phospholipase/acyl hydrolase
MADQVRILSIDGGGIRGIIPAMVVKKLLGDLKAQEVFHIIAGTSTGGIIACGLAKPNPMSPQEIVDLYVERGSSIFQPVSDGILRPKYSPDALIYYLGYEFETTHLSDINASGNKAELVIPSYAIGLPKEKPPGNTCSPMFFRSWQARGFLLEDGATAAEYDFRLSAIARATSAAPTYFPPQPLQNKAGQVFTMIDGGVFANDPAMCALVEAHKLYNSQNFLVVSIGTGSEPTRIDAKAAETWGGALWLFPILTILMEGSAQTTGAEVSELLAENHWRFDVSLASRTPQGELVDAAMDDASAANIRALQDKAQQLIDDNAERLDELSGILASPKASLQPNRTEAPKGMLLQPRARTGA